MFRSGCRWIAAAGFPIRTSPDLHLYTASRGLSQCPTSFIGVWRQGIHRVPLVTCSRDAEKSNFFSFYVDALSIQLVRCKSGALVGCRQVALTWSVPPGDGPLTQHSPAHRRAANPLFSAPYPLFIQLPGLVSQSHQPFAVLSSGGDEGIRTPGLRLAKAALSQLSYIPVFGGSGPDWIRTSDPCVISTVL